jgi:hypothetical protein
MTTEIVPAGMVVEDDNCIQTLVPKIVTNDGITDPLMLTREGFTDPRGSTKEDAKST